MGDIEISRTFSAFSCEKQFWRHRFRGAKGLFCCCCLEVFSGSDFAGFLSSRFGLLLVFVLPIFTVPFCIVVLEDEGKDVRFRFLPEAEKG